jgi:hypothetical protein
LSKFFFLFLLVIALEGGGRNDSHEEHKKTTKRVDVRQLLEQLPPIKFYKHHLYVYYDDDGCWKKVDDIELGALILELDHPAWHSLRQIEGAIKFIKMASIDYDGFNLATETIIRDGSKGSGLWINIKDEVLFVDHKGIIVAPNHPEMMFSAKLDVQYIEGDYEKECPEFLKVLREKLPDKEDQRLFGLFCAYGLAPMNHLNGCLFCLGPHNAGKSTLTNAITNVYGEELISRLKLEQICKDRRNLSDISWLPELSTSMINLGGEIDAREIHDVSNLKSVVTGETIVGRGFREAGGKIRPRAKLLFVMNDVPLLNGQEEITDRIRLIWFGQVTQGSVDTTLEEKLRSEKCGIFKWILSHVMEMLDASALPYGGEDSRKRYDEFCRHTDPYGDFIAEYANVGRGTKVEPRHLQWAIGDYHWRHGSGESLRKAFKTNLERRYSISEKHQDRVGPRDENERKWYQFGIELCGPLWEECLKFNEERLKRNSQWR